MKIRAKLTAFAVVAIAAIVLGGCYAGAPAAQVSQGNVPKPSKQQGYLPVPAPAPAPAPAPNPAPVPEPEPTPVPEPTATPEA